MNDVAAALERLTAEAVEANRLKREENARRRAAEDEVTYQRARESMLRERATPRPGLSFLAAARAFPGLVEQYDKTVPKRNFKPARSGAQADVKCRCGEVVTVTVDRATGCVCGRSFVFDGEAVRVSTARCGEATSRS
jgi:hypothetical protein